MNEKVINIEAHNNFKGYRGSLAEDGGIITKEIPKGKYNPAFHNPSQPEKGVVPMEISEKEYIDQRIDSLEKSLDHRFDSTEKLLSEKMDHLAARLEGAINLQNAKIDGSITNLTTSLESKITILKSDLEHSTEMKLNTFKADLVASQKNTRNNIIGWLLGGGAIFTAIGIAIAQTMIK